MTGPLFDFDRMFANLRRAVKEFNPEQARDDTGKWTSGGGEAGGSGTAGGAEQHMVGSGEAAHMVKRAGDVAEIDARKRYSVKPNGGMVDPDNPWAVYDTKKGATATESVRVPVHTAKTQAGAQKRLESLVKGARTRAETTMRRSIEFHNDDIRMGFYKSNPEGARQNRAKLDPEATGHGVV